MLENDSVGKFNLDARSAVKTVFQCSRFARAGGANMFQLLL